MALLKGRYTLAHGPNPVSQHNAFVYLNKYWRNYWMGTRYYALVSRGGVGRRLCRAQRRSW